MPHLICIGAQRAATTWLYQKLTGILSCDADYTIKEIQYFNEIWLPYQREWASRHRMKQSYSALQYLLSRHDFESMRRSEGCQERMARLSRILFNEPTESWYRNNIMTRLNDPSRLSLDFTPEYALLPPDGVKHLSRLAQGSFVVFVMRDPIQRAFSHLLKLNRDTSLSLSLDSVADYIDVHPDIVARSDYMDTIRNYRQHIPDDKFLLVFDDQVSTDPIGLLSSILSWLQLSRPLCDSSLAAKVHVSANKTFYSNSEAVRLKEIFWSRFSNCYNKMESEFESKVEAWRRSAEQFMSNLCIPSKN